MKLETVELPEPRENPEAGLSKRTWAVRSYGITVGHVYDEALAKTLNTLDLSDYGINAYQRDALRTKSTVDTLDIKHEDGTLGLLMDLLRDVYRDGVDLDHLKANLFYGRPLPEEYPADVDETASSFRELAFRGNLRLTGRDVDLLHGILGLASELSEMLQIIVTAWSTGEDMDLSHLREELGDADWFWGLMCSAVGLDPATILRSNIAKLKARFPDKFSFQAANERNLEAEKTAMEKA